MARVGSVRGVRGFVCEARVLVRALRLMPRPQRIQWPSLHDRSTSSATRSIESSFSRRLAAPWIPLEASPARSCSKSATRDRDSTDAQEPEGVSRAVSCAGSLLTSSKVDSCGSPCVSAPSSTVRRSPDAGSSRRSHAPATPVAQSSRNCATRASRSCGDKEHPRPRSWQSRSSAAKSFPKKHFGKLTSALVSRGSRQPLEATRLTTERRSCGPFQSAGSSVWRAMKTAARRRNWKARLRKGCSESKRRIKVRVSWHADQPSARERCAALSISRSRRTMAPATESSKRRASHWLSQSQISPQICSPTKVTSYRIVSSSRTSDGAFISPATAVALSSRARRRDIEMPHGPRGGGRRLLGEADE